MMKVVVFNQGFTNNVGDNLIEECLSTYFRNNEVDFINIPFWSEKIVFGFLNHASWIVSKCMWRSYFITDILNGLRLIPHLKSIIESDAIIIGGGELLGTHNGFNSSLYVISLICSILKKKLFLFSVSGDNEKDFKSKKRIESSLKRCFSIFVRDTVTEQMIKEEYGIECKCFPDSVFAKNLIFNYENYDSKREKILIIPVEFYDKIADYMHIYNTKDYLLFYYKKLMNNYNGESVVITCTAKEDESISRQLNELLRDMNVDSSYLPMLSEKEIENILSCTSTVIAGRMHALILALINGCNIEPVEIKKKLTNFNEMYNESNVDVSSIERLSFSSYEILYKMITNE